jgi:hypothetical protein
MPLDNNTPPAEPMVDNVVNEPVEDAPEGQALPADAESLQALLAEKTQAYEELQGLHGRHTEEVGTVRKENEGLRQQVNEMQQRMHQLITAPGGQQPSMSAPAPDVEDELGALIDQVREGDMQLHEALPHVFDLAANKATAAATQTFAEKLQEEKEQQQLQAFVRAHPDYEVMASSGQIDAVLREHPELTAVGPGGAYFYIKQKELEAVAEAKVAAASVASAETARKEALEMATDIDKKNAANIGQPGAPVVPSANRGPKSRNETLDSMAAAVDRYRAEK